MTRPGGRSACGLRIAALVAACGVWGLTPQADAGVRVPPNIVIFYADDMGLGDSSAYQDLTANADEHQLCTPNMERLAALGIRCTDAHTAAAVCSPSSPLTNSSPCAVSGVRGTASGCSTRRLRVLRPFFTWQR